MTCTVCDWREVYAKGLCRSDYVFRRRHGRVRNEAEVVREGQKELERRYLANHRGGIYAA